MEAWTTAAPYLGIGGLLVAFSIYRFIVKQDAGTPIMVEITEAIHEGATASGRARLLLFWPGRDARSPPDSPA